MNREDFYKDGNKVLTDEEYAILSQAHDDAEDALNDIASSIRESIEGVMERLFQRRTSTELITRSFTIINRFGDITIRHNDEDLEGAGEISLDDICMVDKLMDILSEII